MSPPPLVLIRICDITFGTLPGNDMLTSAPFLYRTFATSARYDRPVIDCDLMGRAYPTLEHGTPYVYGQPVLPFATADCKGNSSVVVVRPSRPIGYLSMMRADLFPQINRPLNPTDGSNP